jgi:hypothetical protein
MANVVHFQFRLAPGASVGPALLRQIWALASASTHVEVSRAQRYNADGYIYSLSAPPNLQNLAEVETRLRGLLTRHLVGAVNSLVRLP